MSKIMLIDAVHPEETRVTLVSGGRVDDFDFEAAGKKQLRGNIYLAKVTRVEPSLQAAFVEYGGNRHGFLAFSEIHPDYYQLPQEDRDALLREEAEQAAADAAEEDAEDDEAQNGDDPDEGIAENDSATQTADDVDPESEDTDEEGETSENTSEADEAAEEARPRRRRRSLPSRRYKIQEVIRRRQVMLVQVVKEERGNKGAALTTYLSLAGRYCVLMPNTPRGGGISRKIANGADRKRLKNITSSLDVPQGMGLIVRTAGAKRTKTEIKRDFDYLQKLWDKIRDLTLKSIAPCIVNEEGGLVHRAMRDLYDKDVEEVLIQGEPAYREAKDLAKLLMPSHAKKVKLWKDSGPLFVEQGIEEQLDSIFSPTVKLKSGGYLVINQTEALVAIDVNSGKSTRERNIEQTALRTNLEAAEEACRQMRLRDLAGLVVIDFIDMDENKNNRAVEKKLKECLSLDRARVQHGRISQFGLMEISRQRRRAGVLDASSDPCAHCNGTGRVRSTQSAGLQLLRAIEARASGGGLLSMTVHAPADVAIYLLNNKREAFSNIEAEAGIAISFKSSESLLAGDFSIQAERDPNAKRRRKAAPTIVGDPDDEAFAAAAEAENAALEASEAETDIDLSDEDNEKPRRRRRRGGRGRNRRDTTENGDLETSSDEDTEASAMGEDIDPSDSEHGEGTKRRRRRGRRGGRRRQRSEESMERSDLAVAAEEATATALALPPIESTPARGKDAAPEDGGAYLDGLSVTVSEVLDEGLDTIASERPERPADTDEDTKPARARRSRRRRSKSDGDSDGNRSDPAEETASGDEAAPTELGAAGPAPEPVNALKAPAPLEAPAGEPVPAKEAQTESEAAPATAEAQETPAIKPLEPTAETSAAPAEVQPNPEPEPAKTEAAPQKKKRGWWSRRKTG